MQFERVRRSDHQQFRLCPSCAHLRTILRIRWAGEPVIGKSRGRLRRMRDTAPGDDLASRRWGRAAGRQCLKRPLSRKWRPHRNRQSRTGSFSLQTYDVIWQARVCISRCFDRCPEATPAVNLPRGVQNLLTHARVCATGGAKQGAYHEACAIHCLHSV